MELLQNTALELGTLIRNRELTAVEAMEAVYKRMETEEKKYHCFLMADRETALEKARLVQKQLDQGWQGGILAGVPMAVKDNICTRGVRTTCASRMLENFVPPYTASSVRNLEESGAVLVGKTNLDEFAMGSTTEYSAFGLTRNPWDLTRVPGGSSGGSAAAVAAGECFFALGSDTGGSVRQPAAFCGVVGVKPTYGLVSRYGLVAYGSSLDQIGPITRNVADAAAVLSVVASVDPLDATSLAGEEKDFLSGLIPDVKGLRIGIPKEYLAGIKEDALRKEISRAVELLEAAGAHVEEFPLIMTEYAVPVYYTLATAEASSNLARFDGVSYGYRSTSAQNLREMCEKTRSEGFGPEVKRRILLGTYVLSAEHYEAYYQKAQRVKTRLCQVYQEAFEKYDIILGPTAPGGAPKLGEGNADPMQMYYSDFYTIPASLLGAPAISVPCGLNEEGLPLGIQFMGKRFSEKTLFRTAFTYEQMRGNWETEEGRTEEGRTEVWRTEDIRKRGMAE